MMSTARGALTFTLEGAVFTFTFFFTFFFCCCSAAFCFFAAAFGGPVQLGQNQSPFGTPLRFSAATQRVWYAFGQPSQQMRLPPFVHMAHASSFSSSESSLAGSCTFFPLLLLPLFFVACGFVFIFFFAATAAAETFACALTLAAALRFFVNGFAFFFPLADFVFFESACFTAEDEEEVDERRGFCFLGGGGVTLCSWRLSKLHTVVARGCTAKGCEGLFCTRCRSLCK